MEKEKTVLSDLVVGDSCIVTNVMGEGKVRRRLFDMGVTPGAGIKIVKKAPLGDPIQVIIRNYDLTLRKTEAELVVVKKEGVK